MAQVTIPGGAIAYFWATFNAHRENEVRVLDVESGVRLWSCRNYSDDPNTYSYNNTQAVPVALDVQGWHKKTPPNQREDWHRSSERPSGVWPAIVVGMDDSASDRDYNDVSVRIGPPPAGAVVLP